MIGLIAPQWRRILMAGALLLAVALGLGLAPGQANPAFAGDPIEANKAVAQQLSAAGYNVLDVTGPDTDSSTDTATVIMTMVSRELDARVTAQLYDGWVALDNYYKDVPFLRNGLFYQQRYVLVYVISHDDWRAWLNGQIENDDFWNHVQFAVFDTTTQQYLQSGTDFVNKNFNNTNPPGPDNGVDPANVPGDASGLLLDTGSLLIAPDDADGMSMLARVMDTNGLRVPGQTVTYTVSTRNAGDFSAKNAQTDREGVARSNFVPRAGMKVPGSGVPVSILVSGASGIKATQKLLVANFDTTDKDASGQIVQDALDNAGYDVVDFFVNSQTAPTGEVYEWGGPFMEADSSQFDSAFFHQAKAGMGTTLAAFPDMTEVMTFLGFVVNRKTYWIRFDTDRTNWDNWIAGKKTEQDFWGGVSILAIDNQGNLVDTKNFADKDFGTGRDVEVHTSDTVVSYTARLAQEDWGPQRYYGEFNLPVGATMDNFSATLSDGATGWRIYEVGNLHQPLFDSTSGDVSKLVLGGGNYFLAVTADTPPAAVTIKAKLHVRY